MSATLSTKGWNWGQYNLTNESIEFLVDSKKCFSIAYKDIASSANGKSEVALEFAGDEIQTKGYILCELRFHVPNNEVDHYLEQKQKEKQQKAGSKDIEESDDDDEEITASKLFNDKIVQKAKIGQFAGNCVASIQDLPMIIPRGNYSLDFYDNFAKLHGKTHDYKIMFKDINKIFLLQKPDGVNMVYLLQLDQPLRQGMTLHYFIAMHFELERDVKLKVNLTPEEIKQKYGDNLKPEIEGKLYDVLSTLFNNLVGIKKIIVPGEFKSSRGCKALNCCVKATDGYIFPLKSSIVFIHKPVIYVRHSELKYVEFSRTEQGIVRTFDLTLTTLKDDKSYTFLSIDKEEYNILVQYFKTAGVKMKNVDTDGKKSELKDVQNQKKDQQMAEYDDEEESEDESFNEQQSGDDDDDEEGSEDDLDDVEMVDEELDNHEVKALQKEVGKIDIKSGRPKRTQAKK